METINLFGSGGHALVVSDIVRANGNIIGAYYDDKPIHEYIDGIKIEKAEKLSDKYPIIVAVGSNEIRKRISERYNVTFTTAIHPSAILSPNVDIGVGSVIMQGVVIQSRVRIGISSIINTAASIDHECHLGDYVHISPHATLCGNVHVGDLSWVGAGAILIPGIRVGKNCIIGAGSVINRDIPDNCVVVGNPGRIIKKR